jgi:hypothetical protein
MTETLPYGAWRSPITSDLIVAQAIGLGDIIDDGADIYWIEGRPSEGGRNVLVRRGPAGSVEDITPPPFSARTRVHEYGGGAATVHGGLAFFSNFSDQRLYRQAGGSMRRASAGSACARRMGKRGGSTMPWWRSISPPLERGSCWHRAMISTPPLPCRRTGAASPG